MKDWEAVEADVDKILSVHYTKGRGGRSVDKIVVHYNAGNLTVEGCYSVWQTRAASAHYQVESSGRIGQLVWDRDTAWHAGDWDANATSIGIEHANLSDGTITNECLDNGAHLVAALCKEYGLGRPEWLKNVFPHKYFSATSCPGQIYGSQKDAYIQRAQYWYDIMTAEKEPGLEDDLSAEDVWNFEINGVKARDRLIGIDNAANGANNKLASTADPTGRDMKYTTHDHVKWMAKNQADHTEKLDAIAETLADIKAGIDALSVLLSKDA